jgi:RNA recognition motif-containing protein
VRCAKVVLDDAGFSKGYGFVRFSSEAEQQHALNHMSGEVGLGSKPIKVSMANQKNRSGSGSVVGVGTLHVGHQNGAAGAAPGATWAATLDVQVKRPSTRAGSLKSLHTYPCFWLPRF